MGVFGRGVRGDQHHQLPTDHNSGDVLSSTTNTTINLRDVNINDGRACEA